MYVCDHKIFRGNSVCDLWEMRQGEVTDMSGRKGRGVEERGMEGKEGEGDEVRMIEKEKKKRGRERQYGGEEGTRQRLS